jgi:ABC-type xylose transport system permease subunit
MSWDHHQYKTTNKMFYTDGDLRTFILLFYVALFLVLYWWWSQDIYFKCSEITISIKQEIKQHKTVKKMSWERHQYKPSFLVHTDGDLRTFTLLFYAVLFFVLYWWGSQNIYFTSKCPEITISITQEIKQHKTVK